MVMEHLSFSKAASVEKVHIVLLRGHCGLYSLRLRGLFSHIVIENKLTPHRLVPRQYGGQYTCKKIKIILSFEYCEKEFLETIFTS